jgi:hypothetical protein
MTGSAFEVIVTMYSYPQSRYKKLLIRFPVTSQTPVGKALPPVCGAI